LLCFATAFSKKKLRNCSERPFAFEASEEEERAGFACSAPGTDGACRSRICTAYEALAPSRV